MNGKRVLILGGSHSELPLIRSAQKLGFTVITSGNRPDHPGHAIADEYHSGDFSDAAQMTDIARKTQCDFVVSAANDYAYLSACEVAETLRLPGFDPLTIAEILHHKHRFKPVAAALGMPVTRFVTLRAGEDALPPESGLRYPLVVKPVDLTGGKGISVVAAPEKLAAAISSARKLSRSPELVIEEYFVGTLHSYSTIIESSKIVFEYADNEYCHPNPYLVSTSTSIASVPLPILADLRRQTEALVTHLGLVDGILHCQFLFGGGEYVILEYTRRCSGDLYSEVVEAVTGVRHAEQFVRVSTGLPLDLRRSRPVGSFVSRHCIFPDRAGHFAGIEIDPALKDCVMSVTESLPHDYRFDDGWKEKAAVALLNFDSHQAMLEHRPQLNDMLRCRVIDTPSVKEHASNSIENSVVLQ